MNYTSQPSTSSSQTCGITQPGNDQNATCELKFDYMTLLDDANAIAGNLNIRQSIVQINSVIDKAESLFPKVKNTSEMFLDAKLLHATTTSLEQTAYNLDVGEGNFKLFTFAEQFKMKALDQDGKTSWEVLAAVAKPVIHNSLPSWSPLLGSFEFLTDVTPSQQKKARQPRQKDQVMEKKEPEKLSQVDKTQDGVEVVVQRIFSKLKKQYRNNKHQPINYFRFVVNPTSFSDTVENIFHFSFLVNDGYVKLDLDGDMPMICPVTKGKENSNPLTQTSPQEEKKQNIFTIDMRTWQELIAGLKITEAMI